MALLSNQSFVVSDLQESYLKSSAIWNDALFVILKVNKIQSPVNTESVRDFSSDVQHGKYPLLFFYCLLLYTNQPWIYW